MTSSLRVKKLILRALPLYLNEASATILHISKSFSFGAGCFFPKVNLILFLHLSSDGIGNDTLNLHMQITKESYFILITDLIVFLNSIFLKET